jgi:hypothetical protein
LRAVPLLAAPSLLALATLAGAAAPPSPTADPPAADAAVTEAPLTEAPAPDGDFASSRTTSRGTTSRGATAAGKATHGSAAVDADPLFASLHRAAPRLDPGVLERALAAARCAESEGLEEARPLLTVIDYSLPSTRPRLWVLDLARRRLLARELVAHGVGSGENYATRFSNVEGSRQSSLGLFVTADTYQGKNGYSLRLEGLEPGLNDLALQRTIVIHGAWYVSPEFAEQHGRLGRSWGCPALEPRAAQRVIDLIKDGTLLFIDSTQTAWHDDSRFLACNREGGRRQTAERSEGRRLR